MHRGHHARGAVVLDLRYRPLLVHRLAQPVGPVVGAPRLAVVRVRHRTQVLGRIYRTQFGVGGLSVDVYQNAHIHRRGVSNALGDLVVLVVNVFGQTAVAVNIGHLATGVVIRHPMAHARGILRHDQPVVGIVKIQRRSQIGRLRTALLHTEQTPSQVVRAGAAQTVGQRDRDFSSGSVIAVYRGLAQSVLCRKYTPKTVVGGLGRICTVGIYGHPARAGDALE